MAVLASKAWMPRKSSFSAFGWGGAESARVAPSSVVRRTVPSVAAGPCDSVAEGVDAAEAGGGVGLLDGPLGWCGGGEQQD